MKAHAIVHLEHNGERTERAWTIECRCGWVEHDCSTRDVARSEYRQHVVKQAVAKEMGS